MKLFAKQHVAKVDRLLTIALAGLGAAIAWWGFGILGPALQNVASWNIWFQADNPRVIVNLTDPASSHYRTSVHPAASILLTPIVQLLHKLGLPLLLAAKVLIVVSAALCTGLMYAALRCLGLPRPVALIFTALYLSSAAFLHFYSQIELNALAGVTVCAALLALASPQFTSLPVWVLMSAATLSITVTNWSIGLAATLFRWPLRKCIEISVYALVLVTGLSVAQKLTFYRAELFFRPSSVRAEIPWPRAQERDGAPLRPVDSVRSLLVTTVVAPEPIVEVQHGEKVITNQNVPMTNNTVGGVVASFAWLALLVCGVWGAVRHRIRRPVVMALGLMLLGQIVLHSLYGNPTFLYSPHFLPLLVMLAALSWFTPIRGAALGLAVIVCVAGGTSNVLQFQTAARLANEILGRGGNNVYEGAQGVLDPAPPRR